MPPEDNPLAGRNSQRWTARIADQAVTSPDSVPRSLPQVRQQALQVRSALEAVHRGDNAAAQALLQEIDRGSPLADWRIFVRGLAAFYDRDGTAAVDIWSRLDQKRKAWNISRVLMAAGGLQPMD